MTSTIISTNIDKTLATMIITTQVINIITFTISSCDHEVLSFNITELLSPSSATITPVP